MSLTGKVDQHVTTSTNQSVDIPHFRKSVSSSLSVGILDKLAEKLARSSPPMPALAPGKRVAAYQSIIEPA